MSTAPTYTPGRTGSSDVHQQSHGYSSSLSGSPPLGGGGPSPSMIAPGPNYQWPAGHGSSSSRIVHEDVYRRLHEVEQKLQYVERREQEGWRNVQHQLTQIQDTGKSSTTVVSNLELKIAKDIQFIEENLSRDVQLEAQRRGDSETRLRQLLHDEVAVIRGAIESSERGRNTDLEIRVKELGKALHDVIADTERKFADVSAKVELVGRQAAEDATRCEQLLGQQQEKREAAEANLLQVLEETCLQLHREIVDERSQRMESHKKLERLLLEASNRNWVRT